MVTSYSVNCMMCGRSSGQVRRGIFVRLPNAPSLVLRDGHNRCGYCQGNLYLEPDDGLLAAPAFESLTERKRRKAS